MKTKGIILYWGMSKFDKDAPIAVIVTGFDSRNIKTGKMLQTYILRTDTNPVPARANGTDESICGDCVHRLLNTCYVNLAYDPNKVFEALHRMSYDFYDSSIHDELLKNEPIRFGSYGDPLAAPYEVWENLTKLTNKWTGYTHSWDISGIDERFKNILMASVEDNKTYRRAKNKGWKTFRTKLNGCSNNWKGEFTCPALNHGVNCVDCLACMGKQSRYPSNPTIPVHGLDWKKERFEKWLKSGLSIKDLKVYISMRLKAIDKSVKKQRADMYKDLFDSLK